jgi:CBS domain-containing protein
MSSKKIRDYVNNKKVCSVTPDSSVEEAAKLFGGGYVLVKEKDQVKGIFTESDLAKRVVGASKDVKKTLVADVMTKDLICADLNSDVDSCMFMMLKNNFRHLPVRDTKGEIVNVISVMDILKAKVQELDEFKEASNIFEANDVIDHDEDTIEKSIKDYKS